MIVNVSAAVLLAVVVVLLMRSGAVRLGAALACSAFGFCLASTGVAPAITGLLNGLAGLVSLH
ncbi:hypothetical protein [Streptomyces coeruleorubidus]|uniref:DUF2304 family protein n=1 Tax=Streptomyces coeruleorubidus TaxID=116188 RepID=A0ABZ0KRS0_STRC4|nr:hypothetical protein [Streptomyces coeruleorubidus]WOT40668.1 hypothetical protein R5U08_42005 [Streptomyces coeruleorubidus]